MKKVFSAATVVAISAASLTMASAPAQAATPNNYPLSGFFISGSTNNQANIDKLKAIKSVGGDTVITFGSQLKPVVLNAQKQVLKSGSPDSTFTDCKINGAPCAKSVTAGYNIHRAFTYTNGSHWSGSALKCSKDKNVEYNGKLYTLLMIPTVDNGCVSSNNSYDLVMIYGGKATDADPAVSLANAATSLGMKYYVGMPAPIKRTDMGWLPDMSYSSTLGKFTERFMLFHASKNNVAGLAGFYQHTEMPLAQFGFDSVLDVYRMQNAAIKKYLPTREAVVSPYIDARITAAGRVSPADARAAAHNIANTASGIKLNIAVQDGMGTSKGGAYMGNESTSMVDNFAAAYVGTGTWGSKYIAPTGDYYKAAKEGIAGTGAKLWANVEGMAPSNVSTQNACNQSLRGQTTKKRLDRQVQQLSVSTSKNISFMWDDYYTCVVNGKTLAQDLKSHGDEPIISDTVVTPSNNGSVLVAGYNLNGATVTIKFTNANGAVQQKTARLASHNSRYGIQKGADARMESAQFYVGGFSMKSGKYYMVHVINGDGKNNTAFYSKKY